MIYDERVHEIGLMMPNYATAVSSGVIKREAALRDLAEQLGVNREGLESTIALVNALAFEDDADEFGQFRATQMLLGPYYGVPVTGALLGTEGIGDRRVGSRAPQGRVATSQPAGCRRCGAWRIGDAGGGYLEGNGLLSAIVGGYITGNTAAATVAALTKWSVIKVVAMAAACAARLWPHRPTSPR